MLVVALAFARDLNVLSRGDDVATALGVAVPRTTLALHAAAALATAAAVTTAGSVGFVGLVVPHALRLVIGNDQRMLLPAARARRRNAARRSPTRSRAASSRPCSCPVGVITALVGVPAFLVPARAQRGRA